MAPTLAAVRAQLQRLPSLSARARRRAMRENSVAWLRAIDDCSYGDDEAPQARSLADWPEEVLERTARYASVILSSGVPSPSLATMDLVSRLLGSPTAKWKEGLCALAEDLGETARRIPLATSPPEALLVHATRCFFISLLFDGPRAPGIALFRCDTYLEPQPVASLRLWLDASEGCLPPQRLRVLVLASASTAELSYSEGCWLGALDGVFVHGDCALRLEDREGLAEALEREARVVEGRCLQDERPTKRPRPRRSVEAQADDALRSRILDDLDELLATKAELLFLSPRRLALDKAWLARLAALEREDGPERCRLLRRLRAATPGVVEVLAKHAPLSRLDDLQWGVYRFLERAARRASLTPGLADRLPCLARSLAEAACLDASSSGRRLRRGVSRALDDALEELDQLFEHG